MGWETFLALMVMMMLTLVFLRVPVAVALFFVSIAGASYLFGLDAALRQATTSIRSGLTTFALAPVPLFILLAEFLFRFGLAGRAIEALNVGLRGLPGRLALLSTGSGAVLGVVSGSPMATTAMLTQTLVPEMNQRNYSPRLAMGSVLAAGGLSMIIPPSTLAVIWGSTARVPVGPLLIAGLIPGLVMAAGYATVTYVWVTYFGGAPKDDDVEPASLLLRIRYLARDVLPLGLIVFLVIGLILMGVATPTESGGAGVVGALFLALAYRSFRWRIVWESMKGTAITVSTVLLIVGAAGIFAQVMAASGATEGVITVLTRTINTPLAALLVLLGITIILGLFLEQIATILVTIPFFMPIVAEFGINPVHFGILMLISLQVGLTTPPFGMTLFVMKGLSPKGTKMNDIYMGALPFVASDVAVIGLLIAVPQLALWLPSLSG